MVLENSIRGIIMSVSLEVNDTKSQNKRNTEPVNLEILKRLKLSYAEDFHNSPSKLREKLDQVFPDDIRRAKDGSGSLLSDKLVRDFFKKDTPPTASTKTLNYLCKVMLNCSSYGEAQRKLSENEQNVEDVNSQVLASNKVTGNQSIEEDPVSLEQRLQPYYEITRKRLDIMKVLDMREKLPLNKIYAQTYFLKSSNISTTTSTSESVAFRGSDAITNYPDQVTQGSLLPALDKISSSSHLMIMGGPGAGKTSFLKSVGLRYLDRNNSIQDFGKWHIPIYISLKVSGEVIDKHGLRSIISERFKGIFEYVQLEDMLRKGQFLILLDAIDEYTDILSLCKKIEDFFEKYFENRFVITTRLGIPESKIEDFDEVRIANFSQVQISNFVKNWFKATKEKDIASSEPNDEDDWDHQEESNKFLKELENNKSIFAISVNPLMLTYLCIRFKEKFGFPKNASDLLKDVVDIFLRRWDETRRIKRTPDGVDRLSDARKIEMFGQIAYNGLIEAPDRQFLWQEKELKCEISNFLKKVSTIGANEIDDSTRLLLNIVIKNHGLLVAQTSTLYSFPHLTFQEYFVADYIHKNLSSNGSIISETLEKYLFDRQWEQVFLMLAEKLNDSDELFKQMFWHINKLAASCEEIQKMLQWMRTFTQLLKVDSSAWRTFLLAIDLETEAYIKRHSIDIAFTHAQELSNQSVIFNQKRNRITPNQPKLIVALYLVIIHALVIDQIAEIGEDSNDSNPTLKKDASPFARAELMVSKETNIKTELDLAIAQAAEIDDMPYLKHDLESLQREMPLEVRSPLWQNWGDQVLDLMRDRFDIGKQVEFTKDDQKALEDYIYGNNLLLKCILGENVSSPELRENIFDNMLLPIYVVPKDLQSPF
jgi:GTPase SAR1 family protein